jgi:hypothetical protein
MPVIFELQIELLLNSIQSRKCQMVSPAQTRFVYSNLLPLRLAAASVASVLLRFPRLQSTVVMHACAGISVKNTAMSMRRGDAPSPARRLRKRVSLHRPSNPPKAGRTLPSAPQPSYCEALPPLHLALAARSASHTL